MKKLSIGNKILIGIGIVIVIMMLTNPNLKDFKEFDVNKDPYTHILHPVYTQTRTYNWWIFSIYLNRNGNRYVGILKNFFPLD